jgi:hypothetical protein
MLRRQHKHDNNSTKTMPPQERNQDFQSTMHDKLQAAQLCCSSNPTTSVLTTPPAAAVLLQPSLHNSCSTTSQAHSGCKRTQHAPSA